MHRDLDALKALCTPETFTKFEIWIANSANHAVELSTNTIAKPMEQTLALFDQCQVTADGKADPKCVALFEALDNLQVAITGEVITPSSSAVIGAAPAPAADGGQRGQFKMDGGRRNNGCWPN